MNRAAALFYEYLPVNKFLPKDQTTKSITKPKHMNQRKIRENDRLLTTLHRRLVWADALLSGGAGQTASDAARHFIGTIVGLAMLVGLAATGGAQTVAYTANVNTTADYFNNNLNMGHIFSVNGAGIEVFQLGFFDYQNEPLAAPHAVTLFNNETPLVSVTIPAGSVAPLLDSFAFEPLSTPIYLPPGKYTVIAYGIDNADPNGEGGNIGFNGSANLTVVNACYDWTTQGSPDYPGGAGDAPYNGYSLSWDNNTATASFTYTNVTASASTWAGSAANNNWSSSGNWNVAPVSPAALTFAGSTRLANNNDLSDFVATGITFDAAAGAFVLNGNAITLGGTIGFNGNPATPVTQTVNLNIDWGDSETIDTPANASLILGGNITNVNLLTTTDAGTLTLGGTNSIECLSIDGLTGSSTIITGNTTMNGTGDAFYVGANEAVNGCNATLVIQPGAVLNVQGSFGDTFVIGRDGGSGTVIQNGGAFILNGGRDMLLCASGDTRTRAEYDMKGGLLDMSGNNLLVGWGSTLITGVVNQVGGVITNANSLHLPVTSGANGLGIYTLSGGSLYIKGGGIITDGGNSRYAINLGGGTVGAEANWSSPLNMNLTGLNGAVTFDTAGNNIKLSGVLSGNGGLTVIGGGTLELSGANTYTNDTTVNAGILQLDATGSSLGAFRLANGAMLNLNYSGNYGVPRFYTNGVALAGGTYNAGNLPGFITGSGNLVVAAVSAGLWTGGGVNNNWSTGGNWDHNVVPIFPIGLTFAGATRLVNNNDLSSITAYSIMFDVAAGAFVLDGNGVTLNGNIGFKGNPSAPVTQTINLDMAWSASETIDTPANGNLTLGGDITSANNLTKLDAGTLTLGGTNTIECLDVDGGTNTITGNTTINGTGDRLYVGDGDSVSGCNGTLIIQNGAALAITGDFGDTFVIGRDGGSGTIIQNGGNFIFNPGNQSLMLFGATSDAGTTAAFDMNGGLLDMNGNSLGAGYADNGAVTTCMVYQTGGLINNVYNLELGLHQSGGLGVYTLSGGSLYIGANGITSGNGNYAINLGGGTVGAQASWASSLNMNLTNLNGSVTFDTAGNLITLSGTVSGNGGLTVTNSGTLELSGANTYTGDTTVDAGSTLQLDVTGSSLGAFRLANGAMLNLNFSGNYGVPHFYTNGVALPPGTNNAANLPGFITGSGNLVVGAVSAGLWTGGGVNNDWSTGGNWDHSVVPIFPIGLTFAGATRLVNNNGLPSITAYSIMFDAAAGAFVLDGNGITLNGNIGFKGNPATPVTQTINLNMAWSASETIDTPANGNLTLGGDISSFIDSSLIKLDSGTLTLGGTNTIQSWDINGGTTTLTGNTTISGDGGRIYVADGDYLGDCTATLDIQPGAVLNIIGGYGDTFVIGRDSGSGTVNQNGGTFTFNPANNGTIWLGATGNSATRSAYNMNAGLLDMSGNTLGIGLGAGVLVTGLVNQVSGVISNVGNLWVGWGNGHGVYNLTGGSIYLGAAGVTTTSGNYAINLGGGTVGAETSWASTLNMNLTGINGAVTFNPAGNTLTLSGTLSGPGGLTVAGAGTLDLSGTASYAGNTTVNTGTTLELDKAGTNPGAFELANGAVLNLTFGGTYVVGACYTNGIALAAGVYNVSNLPGFITGTGSLTVSAPTPPVITPPYVSGGNLILTGSGGRAGSQYTWLTTTNLTTPIAVWTTNTVGNFDGSGDFSNAIPISTSTPAKFFRMRTP
jgi:autotransporter-associated beta strand protein